MEVPDIHYTRSGDVAIASKPWSRTTPISPGPPQLALEAGAHTTTLALASVRPRTIRIVGGRPGFARIDVEGRKLGGTAARDLTAAVRQILNLDEDIRAFSRKSRRTG